jgi:hypothetical protein
MEVRWRQSDAFTAAKPGNRRSPRSGQVESKPVDRAEPALFNGAAVLVLAAVLSSLGGGTYWRKAKPW